MRNRTGILSRVVLVLVSLGCIPTPTSAESQSELRDKLERMGTEDQTVRRRLDPFLKSGDFQSDQFKAVALEMAAIDARNLGELERIIEQYGWPDVHVVGVDASNSAFLILQHSPLDARKRLLPIFREAVSSGKARAADLAMLEDRILTGDGKKQSYGTQITAGPDGKPRVNPIEDPQNLDARRKAVGLPPMREYLDRMEADIGRPIDKSALTRQREL